MGIKVSQEESASQTRKKPCKGLKGTKMMKKSSKGTKMITSPTSAFNTTPFIPNNEKNSKKQRLPRNNAQKTQGTSKSGFRTKRKKLSRTFENTSKKRGKNNKKFKKKPMIFWKT